MEIHIPHWILMRRIFAALGSLMAQSATASAADNETAPNVKPAPPRNEGGGLYVQLILRNVTVINGTGAPAFGPADVVIEGNRVVQVMSVGAPGGIKGG